MRTVLQHTAIVSRRWPLGGVTSFLDRPPKLLSPTRDEHVESRDHSDPGDRRALGGLLVACGRGSVVWGHKRRNLAHAKFACGKRRLLFIATIELWYSSEFYSCSFFNTIYLSHPRQIINFFNQPGSFYIFTKLGESIIFYYFQSYRIFVIYDKIVQYLHTREAVVFQWNLLFRWIFKSGKF